MRNTAITLTQFAYPEDPRLQNQVAARLSKQAENYLAQAAGAAAAGAGFAAVGNGSRFLGGESRGKNDAGKNSETNVAAFALHRK
jgi:hypothetical protein